MVGAELPWHEEHLRRRPLADQSRAQVSVDCSVRTGCQSKDDCARHDATVPSPAAAMEEELDSRVARRRTLYVERSPGQHGVVLRLDHPHADGSARDPASRVHSKPVVLGVPVLLRHRGHRDVDGLRALLPHVPAGSIVEVRHFVRLLLHRRACVAVAVRDRQPVGHPMGDTRMLNPVAVDVLSQSHARRVTRLGPGVAVRAILFVTAFLYIMGPTLAQWVSFDRVRAEVAAERLAEPPASAIEEFVEPSPQVEALLEEMAPENARVLVGPGLAALGQVGESAGGIGSALLDSAIRAAQIALALAALALVSLRSTLRYKPRHGRGVLAVLVSRKG